MLLSIWLCESASAANGTWTNLNGGGWSADANWSGGIIASGTSGRDAKWGRFDSQQWTVHTTGTLTKILLLQTTPVTYLRGWYGVRRPRL